MRIHLIFAPSLYSSRLETLGENTWPPMGLLYLASYLRSRITGATISITDGCRAGMAQTLKEAFSLRANIIGISFYTTQALGAIHLAQKLKSTIPNSVVVIGGPHASALPEETLLESGADFCVVGEGEEAFFRLVKALIDQQEHKHYRTMPGIWTIEKDSDGKKVIYKNQKMPFITDLDSIPFPARDLVDIHSYRGWFLSKQIPQTTMLFARGCPFECTYCANGLWRTWRPILRFRSPLNIVSEMIHLRDNYGIREIYDQADEFNHSMAHALDVCREIRKNNLDMTWQASLRAVPFSEELAKEMSESGCWCVSLGIESANSRTLEGIKKYITLADVENTCKALRKYGIRVRGHFMLYNVWEEDGHLIYEDTLMSRNTLAYASDLFKRKLINYITWSVTTPYPGSELYGIAKRHNLINRRCLGNWDAWLQKELFIMDIPGLSITEMQKVKNAGELLRIRCMLANRDYKIKDLPVIIKRGFSILKEIYSYHLGATREQ